MASKFTDGKKTVQLPPDSVEVRREDIEATACIMGDFSASADALRRADEHPGPVRFWYSPKMGLLTVELMEGKRHDS